MSYAHRRRKKLFKLGLWDLTQMITRFKAQGRPTKDLEAKQARHAENNASNLRTSCGDIEGAPINTGGCV